jgi:hypothetical protein
VTAGGDPARPDRVRVSGPRATTRRLLRPAAEIDAQTEIGVVYVKSLMRAQLRLAGAVMAPLVGLVGSLPLAFWLWPPAGRLAILGVPAVWVVLGFAAYPFLVVLGWLYVRHAEKNERAFAEAVRDQ